MLMPAFTRLKHECQDLLSPSDGTHVCTDWTSVYTHPKEFRGMESELMLTSRGKSPLPEAQRRVEPATLDRLVGLVVKASASRAEGPGFESRLRRDFFGVESYQ